MAVKNGTRLYKAATQHTVYNSIIRIHDFNLYDVLSFINVIKYYSCYSKYFIRPTNQY